MSTTPAKLSVAAGAEVVDLARVVIVAETESSDVGLAVFDTSAGVVVVGSVAMRPPHETTIRDTIQAATTTRFDIWLGRTPTSHSHV